MNNVPYEFLVVAVLYLFVRNVIFNFYVGDLKKRIEKLERGQR